MSLFALVWVHLIAAVGWIGGTMFLSLVLAPSYRALATKPDAGALFRTAARRFRLVVWGAVAVLLLTGPMLALSRGWPLFEPARWPSLLGIKLSLVAVLLLMTLAHDLVLGPRVRAILALPPDKRASPDRAILAAAAWLPRVALVLALAVLYAAVMLVRS
jgi:putative copper resistance protein D